MNRALIAILALLLLPAAARAGALPLYLDLQAPFPHVTLETPATEPIAPGVTYGDYELWSDLGPLSVHVLSVDLTNPGVRLDTVLASDALESQGERLSSMAQRTGAVAGINGDYFDIGASNRPTNIVVRDGTLLRTPRKRYALALMRTGGAHFAEFSFTGTAQDGTQSMPLSGVNVMPQDSTGVTLLTPAFGNVEQHDGITLAVLQPVRGTPPFGAYRVASFAQSGDGPQPPGYYLVFGSDAASGTLPNDGDTLAVSGTLSPISLDQLALAIGGGPLILYDGHWYDDPDGPRGGEFDQRIPCSGAALEDDGTLLLIEVDGRQPEQSIGLTRPEFAELMHALGASNGIAFDGGGSSTMVARLPGEPAAVMQNSPSDGSERRIAEGLLLYNDAATGLPNRLVAFPSAARAMTGAEVPLQVGAVDANEHPVPIQDPIVMSVEPASLGRIDDGRFVANAAGTGVIRLRAGALDGSVPVEVVSEPSRLMILPPEAYVEKGGTLALQARAFDAAGYELAMPASLQWSASSGRVDEHGTFIAADGDADVRLDADGQVATLHVVVGSHTLALDVTQNLHFLTFPSGGSGSTQIDASCTGCIRLTYAISPLERAAYAVVEQALPPQSVGLSFDVQDDGSGAELRVALRNAINEQVLLTATTLDQPGRRHIEVRFPPGLAQPLRLVGFYVIGTKTTPNPKGFVVIGNVQAEAAGSQ